MNLLRKPIQAVFGDSFFLRYRIYIILGMGSMLANICLLFADFILFWMEIAFLIYHISATSTINFMTANFIFPIRKWFNNDRFWIWLKPMNIHNRSRFDKLFGNHSKFCKLPYFVFYFDICPKWKNWKTNATIFVQKIQSQIHQIYQALQRPCSCTTRVFELLLSRSTLTRAERRM